MSGVRCLTDDELVVLAFDAGTPDPDVLQHIAGTDCCEARLVALLQAARGVTLAAVASAPGEGCLTDGQLAELAQGGASPEREVLCHLAACADCSSMLSSLIRLLDDTGIRAEVSQVESQRAVPDRRRTFRLTGGGAVAAALLAGVVLLRSFVLPDRAVTLDAAPHRQSASVTGIVPRILPPITPHAMPDTLRWTSVPYADRYQVLLFDREGALTWEAQTRDTAIALPQRLNAEPAAYLWKVEARIEWNRWVASEWAELAIPSRP